MKCPPTHVGANEWDELEETDNEIVKMGNYIVQLDDKTRVEEMAIVFL
jgi:hypothetical protein